MNNKTLKVSEDTWRMLNKMKFEYGYKNLDEIIIKLLEVIPANKLIKK